MTDQDGYKELYPMSSRHQLRRRPYVKSTVDQNEFLSFEQLKSKEMQFESSIEKGENNVLSHMNLNTSSMINIKEAPTEGGDPNKFLTLSARNKS